MELERLAELSQELVTILKMRRMPVGIRYFDTLEQAQDVPKVRFIRKKQSVCQIISQASALGWTVGAGREAISLRYCATINGLHPRSELFQSGKMLDGVWHSNAEAAAAHNQALLCMPQKEAVVASPLSAKSMMPEAVLLFSTPGAIFMALCGLLNEQFQLLNFPFGGESTCSMSWIRTVLTGEPGLSTCCFAERKFAGIGDDEMMLSLRPDDLERTVSGLKNLHQAGLRYPIVDYSILVDSYDGYPPAYHKYT